MRRFRRIPAEELPENLSKPVVLIDDMETGASLLNLSPIGIGIKVGPERPIKEGDLFELKFFKPDMDIKCVCVFSEKNENGFVIGAYFRNREDHHVMLKALGDKAIN